jgi:hypothetical protein
MQSFLGIAETKSWKEIIIMLFDLEYFASQPV